MTKQIVVSFDELLDLEIRCACGDGLIVSLASEIPRPKPDCPGCGTSLGDGVLAAETLRKEFRKFATAFLNGAKGRKLSFRIAAD